MRVPQGESSTGCGQHQHDGQDDGPFLAWFRLVLIRHIITDGLARGRVGRRRGEGSGRRLLGGDGWNQQGGLVVGRGVLIALEESLRSRSGEDPFQVLTHLCGGGVAVLRILRQGLERDGVHGRRHLWVQGGRR